MPAATSLCMCVCVCACVCMSVVPAEMPMAFGQHVHRRFVTVSQCFPLLPSPTDDSGKTSVNVHTLARYRVCLCVFACVAVLLRAELQAHAQPWNARVLTRTEY